MIFRSDMSLDIYLMRQKWISYDAGETLTEDSETIYQANITHNLGKMAGEAGIYEALWRPYQLREDFKEWEKYAADEYEFEGKCVIKAIDIIPILEKGLADLKARPEHFETFNSPNGWGMYEHFVPFVEKYLEACKEYPQSIVNVCR
jgi:hypothetical protein